MSAPVDRQTEPSATPSPTPAPPTSTCIDWYAEGQARVVEVAGVRITVRFTGRKGRRGRIAIEAPAGAVFTAEERECQLGSH
jgi:hypothetical protein